MITAYDEAPRGARCGHGCDRRHHVVGTGFPKDYEDECVSTKVVKIIQSYTRIVERTVWGK